jgi:NADH dehydrogenase (ubiquinone) 1 beta subcomplex subunit 3
MLPWIDLLLYSTLDSTNIRLSVGRLFPRQKISLTITQERVCFVHVNQKPHNHDPMQSLPGSSRMITRRVPKALNYTRIPLTHRYLSTSRSASRPVAGDPWAKREAWRHSPTFGQLRQISQMFPGLGLAIVAFGAYLAWEQVGGEKEEEHKTEHH